MADHDKLKMEDAARGLVRRLKEAGHEAWFVGGAVRDLLLGRPIKDIDIVTNARPEQVEKLFAKSRFVGKKFGVCLVRLDGHEFEVATYRRDGAYLDHRHPDSVTYGTQREDAARRDFTINALYLDPETGEVIDFHGGREDLQHGLVRCVGDARKRFTEDALRLLRAVRFAARLGFDIEQDTSAAIQELAGTIEYISPERQRDELTRMLTGPAPGRALELLSQHGLLYFVLPEIEAMRGVEQGRTWHPEGDVFEHTKLVLEKLEPRTSINAWAALLHDVGKPPTFERTSEGKITFYEHQNVGADMARQIMRRLKFSSHEIEYVEAVVRRHMAFMNAKGMRTSTLRRFLAAETIEHDLAVHRADCLGCHGKLAMYDFCLEKLQEFRAETPHALPPPLLRGADLMAMGHQPGPIFGEILEALQEKQLEGELANGEEARRWVQATYPPPPAN